MDDRLSELHIQNFHVIKDLKRHKQSCTVTPESLFRHKLTTPAFVESSKEVLIATSDKDGYLRYQHQQPLRTF